VGGDQKGIIMPFHHGHQQRKGECNGIIKDNDKEKNKDSDKTRKGKAKQDKTMQDRITQAKTTQA
jgi:hypothetical protein